LEEEIEFVTISITVFVPMGSGERIAQFLNALVGVVLDFAITKPICANALKASQVRTIMEDASYIFIVVLNRYIRYETRLKSLSLI
jgi:hypothetical protein